MDNTNVIDSTAVQLDQLSLGSVARIPAVRQVMLLVGVAAAVAAGFAVVLWSQTPQFTTLYADMPGDEAADVVQGRELRCLRPEHDPVRRHARRRGG